MSRGPRDLRDLICVSRLTFRQSDEEVISDDERVRGDLDNLSVGSSGSCDSRQGSASKKSAIKGQRMSPDSGCITNESSPSETISAGNTLTEETDLKLDLSYLGTKKKSRKKKKKKVLEIEPARLPFPKPAPLPPVGRSISVDSQGDAISTELKSASHATYVGTKSLDDHKTETDDKLRLKQESLEHSDDAMDEESAPVSTSKSAHKKIGLDRFQTTNVETGDYDEMMCYMDATIVSSWLARANQNVSDISEYISAADNYVQFAHFWLTDFPDIQKREIFEMEIEILREELGFAFAVGRDQGKVSQHDISNLIGAIFREYPVKLLSSKGNFLFLDYLDILSSERTPKYKKLLSDVKCSTKNRQYAQWLLATRSFALVSIWCAIVNFYRNLLGKNGKTEGIPFPHMTSSFKNLSERRLFQALRHGYADVIHYMNVGKQVNLKMADNHNRTLIFSAVMHNKPKVVHYLVSRVKPEIDVNRISDTGNTALHAAVNSGSVQLVLPLLRSAHIDVNCINSQCENATPLHLAVMHGHKDIVDVLLKAGANRQLKMGDQTPEDIARDFEHNDILQLLQETRAS